MSGFELHPDNRPAATRIVAATLLALLFLQAPLQSDEPAKPIDYRETIQPILAKNCISCHGVEKQKSGLRLDTVAAALEGGASGAAIIPGKSADSLLIEAIDGSEGVVQMPPKGQPPLSVEQIALLKAWIDQGAKAPAGEVTPPTVKKSNHWSFQPVVRMPAPEVQNKGWVRNPIDAFILTRLEAQGIEPAPEADRVTLIRRLSLDLLGLPPSIEEVNEFLADSRSDAYERAVDRLLSSSHYGERWGRLWLDLARYADSNGFTRDFPRSIWKYRDWVIGALNRDLPFDQFTIEQFAGDMLPNPTSEQLIATGFHRNTLTNDEGGTDPEQFRVESVVDRVGTTGVVFLGITLGCAQCHDHKYDPISQREFYQLFAFCNNADEPTFEVPTPEQISKGELARRDGIRKQIASLQQEFAKQNVEFTASLEKWSKDITPEEKAKLPADVINALNLSLEMRNEENKKSLVEGFKNTQTARQQFPTLEQIAQLKKTEPQFVTTMIFRERPEPRTTHIHLRGDFLRKGAQVAPGVPAVLPPLPADVKQPNRLDLARWLVDPRNPLTPRVIVNRIWQKYFGRGIVETENDFGTQGAPPTHPELLDWLASEFIAGKWSLKTLHKLIVMSATYRQSSHYRSDLIETDPNNRLFSRQLRLRLDAELIRDANLAASGLLTRTVGGPGVHPPQPAGVYDFTQDKKPWNSPIGPDRYRRGMYTYLWRSAPYPSMTVFDFPDANVTCTRRGRSNTPLQSLTLANDQAFVEFAQGLAARVLKEASPDDPERLRYAFRLCLAREPSSTERQRLAAMLEQQKTEFQGASKEAELLTPALLTLKTDVQEFAAWTAVSRVLLNLDEFITRE